MTEDSSDSADWPSNYFNYFTEIEDHFQRARGTALFLLSPLDWALIESWKNSDIPLDAVLKGIDETFEKWRSRKLKRRHVNSLAYCTQAVMEAASRAPSSRTGSVPAEPPFSTDQLRSHMDEAAAAFGKRSEPPFCDMAQTLKDLSAKADEHLRHLEDLERQLSALEEKAVAVLRASASADDLYSIRESLDRELRPYRSKMTADQLAVLERRYLDAAVLERAKLPRLSLFYLH
jgi:hypothetical protein